MLKKKSTYRDVHHELIKKCRKGDQRSQMQIYKLYYKAMFNTSLRIVGNKSDAEDVMQDSFIDAFQKIDQYGEDGSFGGWLKRIVVNNSLDHLHKNKNETELKDHMEVVESENESDDMNKIRLVDIKEALKKIKEEYRVIISLYLFDGYDHEEISEILNISYNLSRTRYSRARKKLKDRIEIIQKERSFKWA